MTADGRIVAATPRENEDLFWALRGGGGNVGVVTAFEFDLLPVGEIYGGPMFFELSDAADVLRSYREFAGACPELDGAYLDQRRVPPGGARRHGVRLPRRDLRDGDRGHVAGSRRERREHGMGPRLLRRDRSPRRRAGHVSFMADDDQERIKDNYKGNYDRLVDVKRRFDPDNLLRHNQNRP